MTGGAWGGGTARRVPTGGAPGGVPVVDAPVVDVPLADVPLAGAAVNGAPPGGGPAGAAGGTEPVGGGVGGGHGPASRGTRRAGPPARGARRRRTGGFTLLRTIPGDSPVHQLWAGTKLIAIGLLGVSLSLRPSWAGIGLVAVTVLAAARLARIPRGAVPRLPVWFWATLVVAAFLSLPAGGSPVVHLFGRSEGLGGLDAFGRFAAFGATLVAASMLVGWTTPLADVAPALARLGRPLRWLRLPVDEWAVAVALCVRCLPLLGDDLRTLIAARRLRPWPGGDRSVDVKDRSVDVKDRSVDVKDRSVAANGPAPADGEIPARAASLGNEVVDLLAAALAVALRRSGDMAMAIEARGGVAAARRGAANEAEGRMRRGDVVALVLVAVVSGVAFVLPS